MQKHARGIVNLFDSVLQMLGPDLEFIEEILHQVGLRHAKMGVKSSYFPHLGESLIWALKQTIGDELTPENEEAWEQTYDAISGEITKEIISA